VLSRSNREEEKNGGNKIVAGLLFRVVSEEAKRISCNFITSRISFDSPK
jgi:hypothetical protein